VSSREQFTEPDGRRGRTVNVKLRDARLRQPSPSRPGESMSQTEAVVVANLYLYPDAEQRRYSSFDRSYLGKLESGAVRKPAADRIHALMRTCGVDSLGRARIRLRDYGLRPFRFTLASRYSKRAGRGQARP
jgi:hypothetical protein